MAVTEIVRMYANEGQGDGLQSALEGAVHLLTEHPENLGVVVLRQIEDPDTFILNVRWTSVEAHKGWVASDARASWRETLAAHRADRPADVAHYETFVEQT